MAFPSPRTILNHKDKLCFYQLLEVIISLLSRLLGVQTFVAGEDGSCLLLSPGGPEAWRRHTSPPTVGPLLPGAPVARDCHLGGPTFDPGVMTGVISYFTGKGETLVGGALKTFASQVEAFVGLGGTEHTRGKAMRVFQWLRWDISCYKCWC